MNLFMNVSVETCRDLLFIIDIQIVSELHMDSSLRQVICLQFIDAQNCFLVCAVQIFLNCFLQGLHCFFLTPLKIIMQVHWKWSQRITRLLIQCLESSEYMEIRNALIMLTKISSVF